MWVSCGPHTKGTRCDRSPSLFWRQTIQRSASLASNRPRFVRQPQRIRRHLLAKRAPNVLKLSGLLKRQATPAFKMPAMCDFFSCGSHGLKLMGPICGGSRESRRSSRSGEQNDRPRTQWIVRAITAFVAIGPYRCCQKRQVPESGCLPPLLPKGSFARTRRRKQRRTNLQE